MSTHADDNRDGDELQVHCAAPWISVPQSIILDRSIGDAACRVIIYLIDRVKMPDWKVKIYRDVLPRFGISEYRWPRIRREMELAGYYKCEKIKSKNGPFVQVHHVYYPPLKRPHDNKSEETVKSPPSHSGVSDSGVSDWGVLFKTKESKQKSSSTRDARACAPANAGAAAKGNENKALRIIQGMQCWSEEDAGSAIALAELHGHEAVLDAVKALKGQGLAPVPGRVATALARAAAAARARAASAAAEARLARIDADSRARADRELPEMLAMQARQKRQERDL